MSIKYFDLLDKDLKDIKKLLATNKINKKKIRETIRIAEYNMSQIKESYYYLSDKLNYIKKIGNNFNKKINLVTEFIKSIEKFIKIPLTGGLYGSCVRQILESPFAMSDLFNDKTYGCPIGHDIDICLFNIKPEINTILNVIKFMEFTEQYIRLSEKSNGTLEKPKIGEYYITEIKETTIKNITNKDPLGKRALLGVPKFLIKFLNEDNKVILADVVIWLPNHQYQTTGDFDVNSLILTSKGISTLINFDFYSILNHIRNREAECLIDFNKLQSVLNIGIPKVQRIPHLATIGFFMANRLKILSCGYNITSNIGFPEYEIEKEEPCFITHCEAPYLNLTLECKHKISIAAYLGEILANNCPYSESFKCPLCRNNFVLKLISKQSKKITIWSPHINKNFNDYELEKNNNESILSAECREVIKEYYNNSNQTNQTNLPNLVRQSNSMNIIVPDGDIDIIPGNRMTNNPPINNPMMNNPMINNPMINDPINNPIMNNPMINNPINNPMINDPPMSNPIINNPPMSNYFTYVSPIPNRPPLTNSYISGPIILGPRIPGPINTEPETQTPDIDQMTSLLAVTERNSTSTDFS